MIRAVVGDAHTAVQTTLIGILFAALTLRWGTLWPVILAHAALDIVFIAELERLNPGTAGTSF